MINLASANEARVRLRIGTPGAVYRVPELKLGTRIMHLHLYRYMESAFQISARLAARRTLWVGTLAVSLARSTDAERCALVSRGSGGAIFAAGNTWGGG